MLGREHLARAPEAGLYLVVDEEDVALRADRAQRGEEVVRSDHEPALALNGLDHHARDVARADLRVDDVCGVIGTRDSTRRMLEPERAPVAISERHPVHLRGKRTEAVLVGHLLGRERHAHERPTVERVAEGDDGLALGRIASDLYGVLDRLGPRVREHRLLRIGRGHDPVQRFGKLDVALVHRDVKALVEELVDLVVDRLHDARVRSSDVEHAETSGEIHETIAVDVDDGRLGARVHEYRRRVEHRPRNRRIPSFGQLGGVRSRDRAGRAGH
jgi:hypothetical protein